MVTRTSIYLARLLILAAAVVAGATALADKASKLSRLTVAAEQPKVSADKLRAAGFDVLEGSVTESSFDLVVSAAELDLLREMPLEIVSIESGRPLAEIVTMDDGSRAIPTGYSDLAGIIQRIGIAVFFAGCGG